MTLAEIKTALRNGKYAWPGGYPLYFVSTDGAALSFEGVRAEWHQVCWDYICGVNTGWRIAGVEVNWEDAELFCDATGNRIESAYADE